MSAMLKAIQNKKSGGMRPHKDIGGDHAGTHTSQHVDEGKTDLHGLVASLSESEKHNLKTLLHADGKGAEKIAQGAPSSEEDGHIQNAITKENGLSALEDGEQPMDEQDEIAKSMLDSRDTGMSDKKPSHLGARVRMNIASNLKGKGKI